ncbi:MAG TPA: ATP-binding protein, partial [Candidatus Omnitrophota bacterium]|nr:ATP-binding protein [Candidatus Omnitrophota bacterium]
MTTLIRAFEFNGYAVPVLAVGILMLLIGIFIFLQNKRSRVNFSFFLIGFCGFLWFLGIAGTYAASTPETALFMYRTVTFLGVALIAPCTHYFSATWLGLFKKQKLAIRTGLFFGAAFYIVGLFSPRSFTGVYHYFWGYYPMYGPLNRYFLGLFFLVLACAFFNFFSALLKEPKGVRRTQIGLITLGFLVAFLGSFDYLPKFVYYPVLPLGFLAVFFWILVVAYAIIRYKAMDIETVIHKTLMWLATTVVAVIPFAAFIYWTQRLRDPLSAWGATVYYLAVAVAFYFYFQAIQPRLDYLFQRQRRNLFAVMEKFSQELVHLKSLRDLLQGFARMLRRQLFVRRLSVFLLDEKNNEYIPAIAKGLRSLKPFPQNHPFLAWLEEKDRVVMSHLVGADPEVETFRAEIEQFFRQTQGSVAVPLVLGGKMIGVVSLGRKTNLKPYRSAEIQFLAQLKIPVTIAFSNSMRYENISELYTQVRKMSEELKRWNVELEKRVVDRTRELVKTQEQLTQAEKLATLGTLAGGVAHEINNPLTAVLTNAQILKMTATGDVKESLDLIEEGAKRCQGIVQKLMKYARKTAEETPHKDVDLREVILGTCALLSFQFQQENIEVELKLAEVPPVQGIAGELEQVLMNLLVNARDAIQEGKVKGKPNSLLKDSKVNWTSPGNLRGEENRCQGKITVETRKTPAAVELSVTDNGIGISKEHQKKIFDPFFTTREVGTGTGLGLSIVDRIVRGFSGYIEVESVPGKGA